MISRSTLTLHDREKLEELLGTAPGQLSKEDKAYLKARRDYLSTDEKETYGIKETVYPINKNKNAIRQQK